MDRKNRCWLLGAVFAATWLSGAAHGQTLFETRKLVPTDGAAGDRFGAAVSADGSLGLVGALFDDDLGTDSGSAYLLDLRTGQTQRKLVSIGRTREVGGRSDDFFGHAVALQGGQALVTAVSSSEAGSQAGAAYVFDINTGQRLARLRPFSARFGDPSFQLFGFSASMSDEFIAIGAPGDIDRDSGAGAAYFYRRADFSLQAKVFADDADFADNFGRTVAVDGGLAVVSAPFNDDLGTDSGAAYVFDAASGQQRHKLLPTTGQAQDFFGLAVAIHGNTVAVAAPYDDERGADAGAVYLFDASTGLQTGKISAVDGQPGDLFGFSVALAGRYLVVGVPGTDEGATDAGSAQVFDLDTGLRIAKLRASDAADSDVLGNAVSISGGTVVVGSLRQDARGTDSGAAYVFELDGGPVGPATTVQVADLVPDAEAAGRRFENAQVSVTIRNDLGVPVPGALVTLQLTGDLVETLSGTTGPDGTLTANSNRRGRSPLAYTVCVTDVVAALPYDPAASAEVCDSR